MAVNTQTGEVRMISRDDLLDNPTALAKDEVLVQGTDEDIERLSRGIKALNAEEKRRAKRKAQRAARKRNR